MAQPRLGSLSGPPASSRERIRSNPAEHPAGAAGNGPDAAEVDSAMAAFHGAYVGVNLTDDADQLFNQGQPWTVGGGQQSDPNDGHCIVKVKADGSQLDGWVTWGAVQESTLDWTKACLDEAWVIITPEDAAAANVDIAALRADIDALQGTGGSGG